MITIQKIEREMKTIKKLACLCAVALTGVSYLTSCSSDEVEVNPNYDAERGVVKTEFTISLPAKAAGGTRMTTAIVQGQNPVVFRGIQNIKLFPFADKVATIQSNVTNTSQDVALPTAITLAAGSAAAKLGPSSTNSNEIAAGNTALFAGSNAHLYQDIEIAVGTKAFMFYGVAIPSTGDNPSAINGDLIHNLDAAIAVENHDPAISKATNLEDVTFCHKKIYDGSLSSNATAIINYVNGIATVSGWSTSNNVILQTLYQKFISMKAGSWASVKGAVQQLYSSLYNKTFAAGADNDLKNDIIDAIKTSPASDTQSDGILEFETLGNFPADEKLPDGAIYMLWDNTNHFQMMVGPTNNTGLNITDLDTYVYPAPLYYRALSNIRTADKSMRSYYENKTIWDDGDRETAEADHDDVLDGYGEEVADQNDVVKYTTRSIAIVDQVQYAVARLDVTVKSNTNGTGKLQDNRSTLPDYDTDEDIKLYTLADPTDESSTKTFDKFPVTGILVGNQNSVDYQFHKKGGENYTIYDKIVPTDATTGNYTLFLKDNAPTDAETIHTLAFETPVASSTNDANAIVKIAVEFQNNSGQLFVGVNGEIIYPGSKFYLVGTFDPADVSTNTTHPTGLPNQVFIQDYTTTANLVVNSLRNAYNTMPDLRIPQLELGLSVNLTWNQGITQTINIQ